MAHYRAPGNTGKCLLHRKVICSSDLCRVLLLFMVISLIITPQGNSGYNLEYLSTVICKIYEKKRFMEKKNFRNELSIFIGQIPLSLVSAGAYGAGKYFNGKHICYT